MQLEIQKDFAKKSDPKEMLSLTIIEGKPHVSINFSSLDVLQTCLRKSQYLLRDQISSTKEHPALTFGKAMHKAMEVWYCSPPEHRLASSAACDDSHFQMLQGGAPIAHGSCARCAAIFAFLSETADFQGRDDVLGARTRSNGLEILDSYFDRYSHDFYSVLRDESGPLCERKLNAVLWDSDDLYISFFGTIDMIFQDEKTESIILCDHKTTTSLGSDFMQRIRPNFQYIGYWFLVQEALGIKPSGFMVNGIQVAKTKREFFRQFVHITQEDIEEFRTAVVHYVRNYIKACETGVFPMSTPNACTMWGGCMFRKACEMPERLRHSMLEAIKESITE